MARVQEMPMAPSAEVGAKKPRQRPGWEEAKAEATMTSKEWQKYQEGMNDKWPAPEYMKVQQPGRSHTAYRDETYTVVTRWNEDTRIAYRPHAKAPGTKSHLRYEKYSSARTVGEALKLGSFPADWCWDYERGFIKVYGPVRDEPIDMSKVTDESALTKVDVIIQKWYRRELAKNLGLRYEDLWVGKGSGESTLMRAHRLVAQREATKRLEAADSEGRRVTDKEVEQTLQEWAFARNPYRTNVMREGQTWVWSDTLGLLIDRIGDIHITSATVMYPAVTRIILRWLRERLPQEVACFGFTSINLNCNYAAQLHRDKNNFGPSCIKAFGAFTGGELNYWPEDDKRTKLDDLPADGKVQLQLRDGLTMFNGNCGHSVEDFEGERFSVVYFTLGCFARGKPEDRARLEELGFWFPAAEVPSTILLRAPRGYGASCGGAAQGGPPEVRYWPVEELEGKHFTPQPWPALPEVATKAASRERLESTGETGEANNVATPIKNIIRGRCRNEFETVHDNGTEKQRAKRAADKEAAATNNKKASKSAVVEVGSSDFMQLIQSMRVIDVI